MFLSGAVKGHAVWPQDLEPVAWHRDAEMVRMKLGLYHSRGNVADGEVSVSTLSEARFGEHGGVTECAPAPERMSWRKREEHDVLMFVMPQSLRDNDHTSSVGQNLVSDRRLSDVQSFLDTSPREMDRGKKRSNLKPFDLVRRMSWAKEGPVPLPPRFLHALGR